MRNAPVKGSNHQPHSSPQRMPPACRDLSAAAEGAGRLHAEQRARMGPGLWVCTSRLAAGAAGRLRRPASMHNLV